MGFIDHVIMWSYEFPRKYLLECNFLLEMSTQAIKLMFGPNNSGERLLINSQTRICFQKKSREMKLLNE